MVVPPDRYGVCGRAIPCNDPDVDGAQREQLREWAGALAASDDGERRSSGRAILMLLDRIEELERRLHDRRPLEPPVARVLEPEYVPPHPPDDDPLLSLEDTQPIGLRDRLRLATGRLHER
ncbi:MAG: hypothetical protein QOF08_1242 [Gaiellales bacterium]|nr:hypothetical protein [Gaiellales bacterium]